MIFNKLKGNKSLKYIYSILIVCALTQSSLAEVDSNRSNFYLGAGGSISSLSNKESSETGIIGSSLNIGYDFNEYLTVEFRKGTSLIREASLLLDDSMGLYLKSRYFLGNDIGIYMLTGFASTDLSNSVGNVSSNSRLLAKLIFQPSYLYQN